MADTDYQRHAEIVLVLLLFFNGCYANSCSNQGAN